MQGNATRKLLKRVESLSKKLEEVSETSYKSDRPFLQTLESLNSVVHTVFGAKLLEGWQDNIRQFSENFRSLEKSNSSLVTATPKVIKYVLF